MRPRGCCAARTLRTDKSVCIRKFRDIAVRAVSAFQNSCALRVASSRVGIARRRRLAMLQCGQKCLSSKIEGHSCH